jgi:hypothetical protein
MVFGKQRFDLGFGWWSVGTPQRRALDHHRIVISYAIAIMAS